MALNLTKASGALAALLLLNMKRQGGQKATITAQQNERQNAAIQLRHEIEQKIALRQGYLNRVNNGTMCGDRGSAGTVLSAQNAKNPLIIVTTSITISKRAAGFCDRV